MLGIRPKFDAIPLTFAGWQLNFSLSASRCAESPAVAALPFVKTLSLSVESGIPKGERRQTLINLPLTWITTTRRLLFFQAGSRLSGESLST